MEAIELILLFYNLAIKRARAYAEKLFGKVPTGGLIWKGAVNYYSNLPANAAVGDCYTVKYAGTSGTEVSGTEYAWGNLDGTLQWIPLGPDIDIRLYIKKADADNAYQPKGSYLKSVPMAATDTLGGITAKEKTENESVEAAIDPNTGKMYVPDMSTSVNGKAGNLVSLDENGNLTDSGSTPVTISVDQMTIKIDY